MEYLEDKLMQKISNLKLDDSLKENNPYVFIVDKESQTLNVYDTANQSFCFKTQCSTGKNLVDEPAWNSTPSGIYKIFRMDKTQDLVDKIDETHPFNEYLPHTAHHLGPFCLMYWNEGPNYAHERPNKGHGAAIHGTNEEHLLGKPESQGCVRVSNEDITKIFKAYATIGTQILILK